MRPDLKLKKKFTKTLSKKESRLPRTIGKLGDGYGNLYVDDTRTIVWVRFGETKAIPVFCNRVAPENELQVVVGYSPEQPKLYQVLSTYSDKPGGENAGTLGGYAPAKRYEWLAPKGGQDPLYVHLRAFTPLGIYVSHPPSMSVQLMRGMIINASKTPIEVPAATSDHTAYIPTTEGKAVLVLHTVDNDGNNVETVSSEFDIDLLMPEGDRFANVPALPTDTVFVRGLVRVYYGQTKIQEGRTNRDIIDMRFPGFYGGSAGAVAWADIVGKPETWDELWAELTGASAGVTAIADPLYARKWLKSADPTVDDDTSTGYSKTDLWLNQATSSLFICLDASDGAAVWLPVGSSGGAPILFHADGTLAVLASAAVPYLVTQDLTVESWYIYCEDNGSSSSTIVDVNKNGTTVFTTQSNRPTLAHDDSNNWAISGTPEVTTFTEGDVISIDIDQIATGAKNMLIVGFVSSASGGGGGSFNLIVENTSGTPSISNVGKIVLRGGSLIDDGGGQVTISSAVLQEVNASTATKSTTTTQIPTDDTIPQNTEGAEILSVSITPIMATSKLKIDVIVHGSNDGVSNFTIALFQDSIADAIAASTRAIPSANYSGESNIKHSMTSGTTSPITFKVRVGPNATVTSTINGSNNARLFGGVLISSITVTEIYP